VNWYHAKLEDSHLLIDGSKICLRTHGVDLDHDEKETRFSHQFKENVEFMSKQIAFSGKKPFDRDHREMGILFTNTTTQIGNQTPQN